MKCNYCGKEAEWVENKEIYGRNYGKSYMAWLCRDCDAYVGCHKNTKKSLGSLANKELREWRKEAKGKFIGIMMGGKWSNKYLKDKAYRWLRYELNLSTCDSHFGMFDIEMCKKAIELFNKPITLQSEEYCIQLNNLNRGNSVTFLLNPSP